MVYVKTVSNPFEPFESEKEEIISNISIIHYLRSKYGEDWNKFERPTVCLLNGQAVSQNDFDSVFLKDNDELTFIVLAGDPVTLIFLAVVLVVSAASIYVATSLTAQPVSVVTADTKQADSIYNLKGQVNASKLGQEIPCGYGKTKNFPDYAAKPYSIYRDNDQWQYSLFCLGHGEYDVEDIKIGNTDIANFDEVEYEIIKPNQRMNFFRDSVITTLEASALELLGPNEPGFSVLGPYVVNPIDSEIDRIEADFVFPKGLYQQLETGKLAKVSVTAKLEYREIDNAGNPVSNPVAFKAKKVVTEIPKEATENLENYSGKWIVTSVIYTELAHSNPNGFKTSTYTDSPLQRITTYYINRSTTWELVNFSKNLNSITPKRFTFRVDVPYGRYEVRFTRTSNKFTNYRYANTLVLESLKGFQPNTTFYGAKTLLAVKALASNNLNNSSAKAFNLVQTRKLRTWNGSSWTIKIATRNPIWAVLDVLTSKYGGRISSTYIDLTTFKTLADFCDTNSLWFDYVFSARSNVWDTIKTILAVAKMMPVLNNSKVSAVRDYQLSLPEFIYTDDNIIKGSFKRSIAMKKISDYDGLEVEFINNKYKQENVLCLVDNDAGTNLETLKIIGVSNKTRAKRLGLYHRAIKKLRRELISFQTDAQGYLPTVNSLLGLTHNMTKWGQFDLVKSIVTEWAPGSPSPYEINTITLSEKHTFDLLESYQIVFKQRTGLATIAYNITPASANTNIVVYNGVSLQNLLRLDTEEPLICQFGITGEIYKEVRVSSINPIDINTVEIQCTNNDNTIYSFDAVDAIATDEISNIPTVELPVVSNIQVFYANIDSSKAIVTWYPNRSAKLYVVQYSYDNETWSKSAKTTNAFYTFDVVPGQLYIRIAALNVGFGAWVLWDGFLADNESIPNKIEGLKLKEEPDDSFVVTWIPDINVTEYIVKAYNNWTTNPLNFAGQKTFKVSKAKQLFSKSPHLEFTKTWLKNRCERNNLFFGRQWTFTVQAKNTLGSATVSDALLVEKAPLSNFLPVTLTNVTNLGSDNYTVSWVEVGSPDDSIYYKVWSSTVSGSYPPASMTLRRTTKNNTTNIFVGATRPAYWRVQVLDDWDTDEAVFASNQKTIN